MAAYSSDSRTQLFSYEKLIESHYNIETLKNRQSKYAQNNNKRLLMSGVASILTRLQADIHTAYNVGTIITDE